MKKRTLIILITVPVTILLIIVCGLGYFVSRLNSGYEVSGGRVVFRSFNNMNWKIERREVKGADAASLRMIRGSGGLYASDGKNVFVEGTMITAADPETFHVLDWRHQYSRDARATYWKSLHLSDDPEGFEILEGSYSKDRKHVYYASRVVEGADPQSFEVTSKVSGQGRDKDYQYNLGKRIPQKD